MQEVIEAPTVSAPLSIQRSSSLWGCVALTSGLTLLLCERGGVILETFSTGLRVQQPLLLDQSDLDTGGHRA